MLPLDSAGKKVLDRFMRKSCKRKVFSCKRKELRIEKLIMKKATDFVKWKGYDNSIIAGLM